MSSNRNLSSKIDIYLRIIDGSEISKQQQKFIKRTIQSYVLFCDGTIDLDRTLNYLSHVKETKDLCSYNKVFYCLKRYLHFLHATFVDDLPKTKPKYYSPKDITEKDLDKVTAIFKDDLQMMTLFTVGSVSGLRAYELYSLTFDDIDLSNRTISVNRENGKSTKNLKSIRTTYFNETTRQLLTEYFEYCKLNGIKKPFPMLTINHKLRGKGFQVKDLRHIFIRTASLRGMKLPILQRLIGHSSGMIDNHYLFISELEIKKEYDKIFNSDGEKNDN